MNKEKADLCKQNSYVSNEVEATLFAYNKLTKEVQPKHSVNDYRQMGMSEYDFKGSDHYKSDDEVEPLDLMKANGTLDDFCQGSILKYAFRYKTTKSKKDLAKIIDYAYILYGIPKGDDINGKK